MAKNSTSRPRRSEHELEADAQHGVYELNMLRQTASRLGQRITDEVIKYAVLESFAIHARTLIDFFFPNPKTLRDDDIIAADFFDPPTTWNVKAPTFLTETREDIHKWVAHLTSRRRSAQHPNWDVRKITEEIERVFSQFQARSPCRMGLSNIPAPSSIQWVLSGVVATTGVTTGSVQQL